MNRNTKRILLIEDSVTRGVLVQGNLAESPLRCEVDWVRTLKEGLEKLRVESYHLVLSDLMLPDSNGLNTVRTLRRENHDIPIVVMTGMTDSEIEQIVIEQGATDYLRKSEATPFRLMRTVVRAIDDAMQRRQTHSVIQSLMEEIQAKSELADRQQDLLKKKNQRLQALYETVHDFVENISSEVCTPLNVIKDYLSLVRDELVGPANLEQRRMLDVASVRADDLNCIIDDLLDVSKLESGLFITWRRRCLLDDVLQQVCSTIQRKADVKNFKVDLDWAGDFPELYCGAETVGRAIMHLAANAMKSSGAAGRMRIWARPNLADAEVLIGVEEYGLGIAPDELNSILEQFAETKTGLRFNDRSSGLGLSIAKELAGLNFGKMYAENQPGVSINFWLSVPSYDPPLVFERYLNQQAVRQPGSTVSIVQCCVPSSADETALGDLETFFQHLLRRNDIVFRTHENQWTLALLVPVDEFSLFVERMANEFEIAKSQFFPGGLPQFTARRLGTWTVPAEREEAMRVFEDTFTQRQSAAQYTTVSEGAKS